MQNIDLPDEEFTLSLRKLSGPSLRKWLSTGSSWTLVMLEIVQVLELVADERVDVSIARASFSYRVTSSSVAPWAVKRVLP